MKKIWLLFLFVAMILVACVQTDDYELPISRQNNEIRFNINASYDSQQITRAVVEGTTLPNGSYFGVYGFVKPSANVSYEVGGGYIMKNGKYNHEGVSSTPYYWPKADDNSDINVKFVAYYPWTDDDNIVSLDDDKFTYNVTASDLTNATCTDVLYAIANNVYPELDPQANDLDNNESVDLNFKHALSLIQFQAKKADNVKSVTINSIKFHNSAKSILGIYTTGNIVVDMTNNQITASVSNTGDRTDLNFAAQNTTFTNDVYNVLSTATVIPQNVPDQVTVSFNVTIENPDDHSTIMYTNRTITRTINTGKDDNNKSYYGSWAASNKYIYRLYITADAVDFNVSVDNWTVDWNQIWDHDTSAATTDVF